MHGTREAVKAAKALEVEGREFYLDAAKRASGEALGAMFRALADDEKRHLEWLERLEPGVAAASEANQALYGRLKDVFGGASPGEAAERTKSDAEAIDFAIGIEDRSVDVYAEWAERGGSEEVRRLGEVLVGQERFHRQLLENAKEYLDRPGDWFMREEQWNFEGG
jgi:rubrerythrin